MSKAQPLIVVVDDEVDVCKALARLLRSVNLNAKVFSSGTEFLESLPDIQPDCVLVDLDMPVMSGFEVQARLAPSGVPVVIMTGRDSDERPARVMALKPVAYLLKPVEITALLDAIYLALGSPRQQGEKFSR